MTIQSTTTETLSCTYLEEGRGLNVRVQLVDGPAGSLWCRNVQIETTDQGENETRLLEVDPYELVPLIALLTDLKDALVARHVIDAAGSPAGEETPPVDQEVY